MIDLAFLKIFSWYTQKNELQESYSLEVPMNQKERMLSGKLYFSQCEELIKEYKRAKKLNRLYNQTTEDEIEKRIHLLKEMFASTGERIYIEPPFHCDYGSHIFIGDNFFANYNCIIIDVCEVKIGKNVLFGPGVQVYTAAHPIDTEVRNAGLEYGKPVTIGDNVWVGGNAVFNPGVTIGNDVVIGSGSVVTHDIPDGVVAVGNPCRVLREITKEDKAFWQNQVDEYWEEMQPGSAL